MKSRNSILRRLPAVVLLLMILHAGCSPPVKKPLLVPTEPGLGLSEITDPALFPVFRVSRNGLYFNSGEYNSQIKPYGLGISHYELNQAISIKQ